MSKTCDTFIKNLFLNKNTMFFLYLGVKKWVKTYDTFHFYNLGVKKWVKTCDTFMKNIFLIKVCCILIKKYVFLIWE